MKNDREEACVLLNAIPEPYLPEVVDYFRVLNGLKEYDG
jgi:hypothetical protein